SLTSKAYLLYDPDQRMVVEKRDVSFLPFHKKDTIDFPEMISIENTEDILIKEESEASSEDEADDSDNMFEEAKGGGNSGSDYQESVCKSPIQKECPLQIGRGRPKLLRSGKPRHPRKMYNTINVL
ncbi:unnamed protein product, partial [Ceratitis capitata]